MTSVLRGFVRDLFSEIADPRRQEMGIRLARKMLILFPLGRAALFNRQGRSRQALKALELSSVTRSGVRLMSRRLREMTAVLGSPPAKPLPDQRRRKPWNGKVLFSLHNSLPYAQAGYARRSHTILEHLQDKGIEARAVTRPGFPWDLAVRAHGAKFLKDRVGIIDYHRLMAEVQVGEPDSLYIQAYARALSEQAAETGASVIHAASNYLNGLAAALAARESGLTSIYEVRGLWHYSRAASEPWFWESDEFSYLDLMERRAALEADLVCVISTPLKEKMLTWGVPEEKLMVVPNAVDTSCFVPRRPDEALRRDLGLDGRMVVAFIGSVTAYEGLDLLMRVCASLAGREDKISLVVVGQGHALKFFKKKAVSLPGREHLHFIGQVPFEEVGRYYAMADILCFPRSGEPVCSLVPPLKILEAMAMAKPVIVSDLPPLKEMVIHDQTGLFSLAGNEEHLMEKIRFLAREPGARERLGQSAREWVASHRSWETVSELYLEMYRNILKERVERV